METEAQPAANTSQFAPAPLDLLDATRTSPLPMALCALDRPGLPFVFVNDAFVGLTGWPVIDLCGQGWDRLDVPGAPPVSLCLADAVRTTGSSVLDAMLRGNARPPAACRLYVSRIPDKPLLLVQVVETGNADGEPGGASDTLLRDLRHRVMNHLQFIQSVLHMQSQRVDSVATREALRDIGARVDTLAVVYRQLYASRTDSQIELAGYLGQLVSNLSTFYDREGRIALIVDAPDVELLLPVERAFPLGLIVTELVVNSFKHAFHGRTDGTIAIAIAQFGAAHATVTVRDDGPGWSGDGDVGAGKRLGLTLVRSLAAQIGGVIIMDSGQGSLDRGARIVITVPLGG